MARDPVLLTLAAGIAAVSAVLLSGAGSPTLRVAVFWASQVAADVSTCALALAVVRAAANRAMRRFWLGCAVAGSAFAVGDFLNLVLGLRHVGDARQYHAGQAVFFVLGCVVLLAVMVTYPARHTTAKERLRFWLDATTVLVGCGVFAWCLLISPLLAAADLDHLVESLISSGVVVLIGFALVKLLLSGEAPVTRAAVVPIAAAVVLQACGDTLEASGGAQGHARLLLVVRVLPALLLVAIPRIQLLETAVEAPPRRRRRPYSLLPYLTIAATFALLCAQLAPSGMNRGRLGALVGMALITVLVVVRQLNAFEENADLLERLAYQATHDPLTGLANRSVFTDRLGLALEAGVPVAVVLVDLDGFKQVNDTLGHYAGDLMLVAVADRLRRSVRPGDTPARLGGDEFAVLLPDADAAAAGAVVERFLAVLPQVVDIEGHLVRPRASVGAAVGAGTNPELLLRTADAAMYRVKRGGLVDADAAAGHPARSVGTG
jgi:diguanylate cyclase